MISALLLVAAVASPPAPSPVQGVAIGSDGTLTAFATIAELSQLPAPPEHAWVWTSDLPPVRVSTPTAESISGARLQDELEWRQATIVSSGPAEQMLLVSAPAEMWEEIPERLLPRHRLPKNASEARFTIRRGEPWRVRLLAGDRATGWIDVPARGSMPILVPEPAADWRPQVLAAEGESIERVRLSLLESDRRGVDLRKLADERADAAGRLELVALPRETDLLVLVTAAGKLPLLLRGRVDELPVRLRLERGSALSGSVRTADGLPVTGALVEARSWFEGTPIPLRRTASSDAEGRWRIESLPAGPVTLFFRAEGVAPYSFPIDLTGSSHDVGEVVLPRNHLLHVLITDPGGLPLPAEVRIRGREAAIADESGRVVLELHPDQPLEAIVTADGHSSATVRRFPPLPIELQIRLEPAAVFTGRFLSAEGLPVVGGQIEVETASTLFTRPTESDGRFEIELEAGETGTLRFTSPSTAAFELKVGAGGAGSRQDLGDLTAPAGPTVSGWLFDGSSGRPVAGARVWTLRPGPRGVHMAWALGDLLETTSDATGAFRLSGLPIQPVTLRIEARGLATNRIPLVPRKEELAIDLGEIYLTPGTQLIVRLEGTEPEGMSAVLDLGGRDLEADRMTAPFRDGEALLRHVPKGAYDLRVTEGSQVLCRTVVEVEDSPQQEIACESEAAIVRGSVEVGGRRAANGTLQWVPPLESAPQPDVILNTGWEFLRRQRVFTSGPNEVSVEVDSHGRFETESLQPGEWMVFWQAEGRPAIGPQRVTLPRASEHTVLLQYVGTELHGRVVDEAGDPVPDAQVRTVDGSAFGRSDSDGSFVLGALAPGTYQVQARVAERTSRPKTVVVEEDRTPDAVVLVLENRSTQAVVEVLDRDERPLGGALVFFDFGDRGLRVVSSDGHGRAEAELPEGLATPRRVAAYHQGRWILGAALATIAAQEEPILLIGRETGSLVLVGDDERELSPQVLSSDGWDLTLLHSWLGRWLRVMPGAVLQLDGLPEGTYEIRVDGRRHLATVGAEDQTELSLGG